MIICTLFCSSIITILLLHIQNKYNFPDISVIPILTTALIKYTIGDWNTGYSWEKSNIFYWISVLATSYITIFIYKKY